jgi:hypothetical protein
MSLKEKLCILKNYTLLLLGPSPFEHWLESYLYVTVRPLSFLLFATGSSIVFPEPPISSAPLRVRMAPATGRPRAPAALRHPDLAPRVALTLLPPPALPSLAVPRSSTSGKHFRAAATRMPAPLAVLSSAHDLPLSPSLSHQLSRACPRLFPLSSSLRHRRPPVLPRRISP